MLLIRTNANLDDSVAFVRDNCDEHELAWYRREVGKVMGAVFLDIEQRIWSEHPSLKPEEMGGSFFVDPEKLEPRFYPHRPADGSQGSAPPDTGRS